MNENLRKEAIEFCQKHPVSHLATVEDGLPYARVMYAAKVDDDFSIWYAMPNTSYKIRHIQKCPYVSVTFYEHGKDVFISGAAEIMKDPKVKDAMWRENWKEFFPGGKTDPTYELVKIIPKKVEYRDLRKHHFQAQKIL